MPPISQRAFRGTGWMSASKYITTGIRFFAGIYLARMIDPKFFGQRGFVLSIIALGVMFSQIGFDPAILRRDKNNREESFIRTLLTLEITLMVLISMFILTISWYVIHLKPQLFLVLLIIVVTKLPYEIFGVYRTLMQKEMMFARLAISELVSTIASFGLACFLASLGWQLWALVYAVIIQNVMIAGLSFILTPKRYFPAFDPSLAIDFFHYSKFAFLSSVMNKVYSQGDNFSVGKFLGATQLGFYQRAYGLSNLFSQVVWGGVGSVVGPVFGNLRGSRERLGRAYELIVGLLFRLCILFYLCLGFTIPELIQIIYGKTWLPSATIFRMVLPLAFISTLRSAMRKMIFTADHSKHVAKAQMLEVGSFVILIGLLMPIWDIKGVAVAVDVSAFLGIFALISRSRNIADFSFRQVYFAPLVVGILGFSFTLATLQFVRTQNIYMRVILQSGLVTVYYSIFSFLIEGEYLISMLKRIWNMRK